MENDYEIIGPEYFMGVSDKEVEAIVLEGYYNKELVYSSNPWSFALKNYLILTHDPSLIKKNQKSEINLLTNRYYWLKRFYYLYSQTNGNDVGMEQQIFKLIETIGNSVESYNWDELQRIDKEIEQGK